MKLWVGIFLVVASGVLFLRAADERVAPGLPPNVKDVRTSEFSSEQYFEPPDETKLKLRFSGASLSPLPGGLQEVKLVRIETFDTNGLTRMVAEAPQCELSPFDGVASSSGHLEMRSGDGKFRVTGDGFLWLQTSNALTISNNVHTVFKTGTNSLFKL